jgi:hypothetical protein
VNEPNSGGMMKKIICLCFMLVPLFGTKAVDLRLTEDAMVYSEKTSLDAPYEEYVWLKAGTRLAVNPTRIETIDVGRVYRLALVYKTDIKTMENPKRKKLAKYINTNPKGVRFYISADTYIHSEVIKPQRHHRFDRHDSQMSNAWISKCVASVDDLYRTSRMVNSCKKIRNKFAFQCVSSIESFYLDSNKIKNCAGIYNKFAAKCVEGIDNFHLTSSLIDACKRVQTKAALRCVRTLDSFYINSQQIKACAGNPF